MPIYEYEPEGRECLMCDGRVQAIQGVNEEALKFCPQCGMEVRRVISNVSFKIATNAETPDKAASRGFSTFKRAEKGVWEKVAGPGVDAIVGTPEDMAKVEADKLPPAKVLDLDKST